MTNQEVRDYLNEMLIPLASYQHNIKANDNLAQADKDVLFKIINDFEAQNENYNYHEALKDIAKIMKPYINVANKVTSRGSKIATNPKTMPFLITQVLFYIAVACNANKVDNKPLASQADILAELKDNGAVVSHNFFSKLRQTPQSYYDMSTYVQPSVLFRYNGQKDKHLGVALKNLIYQSGKYNTFVDIFGGSGAASVAFPKQRNAKHVYNELNLNIYNLFEVVKNSPEDLIAELEALKADLRGNSEWLDIDFEKEINLFYNRGGNRAAIEQDIYNDRFKDFDVDYDDIMDFFEKLKNDLEIMPPNYSFEDKTKQEILDTYFTDPNSYFMLYIQNKDFFLGLGLSLFDSLKGQLADNSGSKAYTADDNDLRTIQYRFYMYYAYFDNLLKGITNVGRSPVRKALAYLFIHSLLTQGDVGISAVLRIIYSNKSGTVQNKTFDWQNFLDTDHTSIIETLNKLFKNTTLENLDCIDVIQKYQGKKTLFYSDSPYLDTTGYSIGKTDKKDEDVNQSSGVVTDFTPANMENLIDALFDSGDNFIFSCRACLSGKNAKGERADGKRPNYNIVKMFEHFFNKQVPLWVLTITDDSTKDFFKDYVSKDKVAEVMITNFEIVDFNNIYKISSKRKAGYKVYRFDDFLKKLFPVIR